MYPDGARTAGHRLRLRPPGDPCRCRGCVARHLDVRPAATQRDRPDQPDERGVARFREAGGGRGLGGERAERGGHRSPQRRPVFVAPGPPCGRPDDPGPRADLPWDLRPPQWTRPPPEPRHYAPVREQCGCVWWRDAGTHPFQATPFPFHGLPPPPLGGRRDGGRRAGVDADGEEEGEEGAGIGRWQDADGYRSEWRGDRPGRVTNGHSGRGPPEGRDDRRDRSGATRVPEEAIFGGIFATEVPPKHLHHRGRRGGPFAAPSTPHGPREPPTPADGDAPRGKGASASTVHEQIRRVVHDLEDVLGGLKQVHVEMKEVVDQIDRLTANIDLGEESPENTHAAPTDFHIPPRPGDLNTALVLHHKPPSTQNHVILTTNAPSPVHMASVVKTNRVPPSVWGRDLGRSGSAPNGHPPHLCPPQDSDRLVQAHQELWRPGPDPAVVVGNSTERAPVFRTHKPPPYPQNGRCGRSHYPPPNPVKTPASYPARRRQNTSMV